MKCAECPDLDPSEHLWGEVEVKLGTSIYKVGISMLYSAVHKL